MQYGLYNLLCWLLILIAAPFFILYGLITGKHIGSLKERLGFFAFQDKNGPGQKRLWFHAASVGEVQVAKSIITETAKLIPEASFILSTVTDQGRLVASEQTADNVRCIYAPIDIPLVINRFIKSLRPSAYICLETELWPNMLKTAAGKGVELFLLNGRISDNSYKNYCRFPSFIKEVLNYFSFISCITDLDRRRFETLGIPSEKIQVNGNAKYDNLIQLPKVIPSGQEGKIPQKRDQLFLETEKSYRKKLNIGEADTVLIAGSTHDGEEAILIETYNETRKKIPGLIMIIAPRHTSRVGKIEGLLAMNDMEYQLYSSFPDTLRDKNIILVDTVGDLATLYSVATYVFCGGSMVQKGGHNIMEPTAWGKPVFYGPDMSDFTDARNLLENEGVGFLVRNVQDLCGRIIYFHTHKQELAKVSAQAREVASRQHGSAKKQAEIIRKFLKG